MLPFYIYNTANGQVLGTGSYDERGDGATTRAVGAGVIVPATEYAPGGVRTARPVFNPAIALDKSAIIANATDAATLSAIPSGSVVRVHKDQDQFPRAVMTITDGTLVLRVDTAGRYRITVSNFPTQDAVFTVTAT